MKQNPCCALSFAIKWIQEDFKRAPSGARFTCSRCGQNFRKHRGTWVMMTRAEAVQDILDMQEEENARRRGQHTT